MDEDIELPRFVDAMDYYDKKIRELKNANILLAFGMILIIILVVIK